jgi:rhodanese-related sulfurtransferase
MDNSRLFISPDDLYVRLGAAQAPVVVDVRRAATFEADTTMLAGAIRRLPTEVERWGERMPRGRPVVVYCVYGHEVSQADLRNTRATIGSPRRRPF